MILVWFLVFLVGVLLVVAAVVTLTAEWNYVETEIGAIMIFLIGIVITVLSANKLGWLE